MITARALRSTETTFSRDCGGGKRIADMWVGNSSVAGIVNLTLAGC